jgi:hypothetical protein
MNWINTPFKRGLLITLTIVTLCIAIIILVEAASALLIANRTNSLNNKNFNNFVISKPLAFESTDDFDFIQKLWAGKSNCPKNRIVNNTLNGFPEFENKNVDCFGSEGIVNGNRLTTDQPINPSSQILVFGGSTVWGTGSADHNTIPSILQRYLNKEVPHQRIAVTNFGFSTVVSHQQLSKLSSIPIQKNDIVIFYDGGNDIFQGGIYGNPHGNIIGYNENNKFSTFMNSVKFFLSSNSYFYQFLGLLKSTGSDENCKKIDNIVLENRVHDSFLNYLRVSNSARDYVESRGGKFYHFFQPTLFSKIILSDYESNLINNVSMSERCSYPYLRIATKNFGYMLTNTDKSRIIDLSQSLNAVKNKREYFFDWIHVSSAGNLVVTSLIYESIKENFRSE